MSQVICGNGRPMVKQLERGQQNEPPDEAPSGDGMEEEREENLPKSEGV